MSYRNDVIEELHALKREAGHVLTTSAEEWRRISGQKAQSLAADAQALMTSFRNSLVEDEAEIERALAGRTVPALAAALAAGIAIGWLIRRRP
jgi:glycerol dehydrogenase-like iron-containing ADH family enzyme